MNKKWNVGLCLTFMLAFNTVVSYAQFSAYTYSRALGVQEKGWHQLELPKDISEKTTNNFADIRILGLTETGDSLEVPYLELQSLQESRRKKNTSPPSFEIINQSKRKEGFYYTIKLLDQKEITAFTLNFEALNFEGLVNLEGSHNQQKWFTLLEGYRILGINNNLTKYKFTTLKFPKSNYSYYRILVKDIKDVNLISARIEAAPTKQKQQFYHLKIKPQKIIEHKTKKQTEIYLSLPYLVKANQLTIEVKNDLDFYRRVSIQNLTDSVKTNQGKEAYYRSFKNTILNSWDANHIYLSGNKKIQHLKIIIYNEDNRPLEVGDISIKSPVYQLAFRLPETADCTLFYGNAKATKPNYDLTHFKNKIPPNLTKVVLGKEVNLITPSSHLSNTKKIPNKYWLWLLLGFSIFLLGGFSIKMLRSVE